MRGKMIICDICGRNITNDKIIYKFKKCCVGPYGYQKQKMDMCNDCFVKFENYVRNSK